MIILWLSNCLHYIHNVILFIDTSDNAWLSQADWPIGTPYLSIITSNEFGVTFTVSKLDLYLEMTTTFKFPCNQQVDKNFSFYLTLTQIHTLADMAENITWQ